MRRRPGGRRPIASTKDHHGSRIASPRAASSAAARAQGRRRPQRLRLCRCCSARRWSRSSSTSPRSTLEDVKTGLSNGTIWALIALGYTLVYGIIELINFAHGEVFMIGSFVSVSLWATLRRRRRDTRCR